MTWRKWSEGLDDLDITREEVAAVLREAADHLQKVGLHKGGLFAVQERTAVGMPQIWATSPCCGWGAVEAVRREDQPLMGSEEYERRRALRTMAEDALSYAVGAGSHPDKPFLGHYPTWNDYHQRTQDEVLALMRATAGAIETHEGVFA